MAQILLAEGVAQDTPLPDTVAIYAKTNGLVYAKDDAGVETALGIALKFPFYNSSGALDTISLNADQKLPFTKNDGNASNIPLVT